MCHVLPCITTTTVHFYPRCHLDLWLLDVHINFTDLSRIKECSKRQMCYLRRCTTKAFCNSTIGQRFQELCLWRMCSSKDGDFTDADTMNCMEYCNMTASGCRDIPRKSCRHAQMKYCRVSGRGKQCAVMCAKNDSYYCVSTIIYSRADYTWSYKPSTNHVLKYNALY